MPSSAAATPPDLDAVRARVDAELAAFLEGARADIGSRDQRAVPLVEEIVRVVAAGGKRLRPAFAYWGFRAAGGADGEPILRAAGSLELLHTMALIHDDLMDAAAERRGRPTSAPAFEAFARREGLPVDPPRFGRSAAILAGDLAAVLADRCLRASGFPPVALAAAARPYDRMRTDMAAGQFLDLRGRPRDRGDERRVARLKGGTYTVEGPLRFGAALAGAAPEVDAALVRYGAPLGLAFQLRDDLLDGDATDAGPADIDVLVTEAQDALGSGPPGVLAADAVEALGFLAASMKVP